MVTPDAHTGLPAVSLRIRPGAAYQLDELSKAIIEKLQQDGRRSYAGIGKAVGLSEAAVRQRVQRMVDAGVMQIVAVTDPMQLGFARQAMIGIRCTGDTTKVAEKLATIESVDYVVLTAGSFDVVNAWNTPWLEWVDADRFAAHVAESARLPIEVVVSCHGPILRGAQIADAFDRTRALAGRAIPPTPRQADLEVLLAALAVAA